jgi:hypothetical protein
LDPETGVHLGFGEVEYLTNAGMTEKEARKMYDGMPNLATISINLEEEAYQHLASLSLETLETEELEAEETVGFAVNIMFTTAFEAGFERSRNDYWLKPSDICESDFRDLPQYHSGETPLNRALKNLIKKCFLVGFQTAFDNSEMNIKFHMEPFNEKDFKNSN